MTEIEQRVDRINYKLDIYEKQLRNAGDCELYEMSDLIGCVLDIMEELQGICVCKKEAA